MSKLEEIKKIEEVIVKIWDMAKHSTEPIVREHTLQWAREELCQLFKPDSVEARIKELKKIEEEEGNVY